MLTPGTKLGSYEIVAALGAGGMGEVYRAHDEQLDRDVALKILPAGTLADDAARKQFRNEALALAKLNHPNIETVHGFGTQDGVDFLVLELIRGQSLGEKLKEGPLPERDIIRLGIQFAEGLAAAHEQGIVHRDLKPGNLMVTPEGRLKILDFGLARLTKAAAADPDMTKSNVQELTTVSGTLPYMAPEQLRGERVDVRADIHAAGAVLYEMATGTRAFSGAHSTRLIDAILHETPASPRSMNPRISPGLEAIIRKAMEKERSARYQTAREMLAVLEGLSVGTAPIPAPGIPRWWLAVGGGVVSVLLVLGLAFGWNLGGLRDRFFGRSASQREAGRIAPSLTLRARTSIAVLAFNNVSGRKDQAWLSTALSEMLTTELAAGEKLRLVPGENVARMKIDLALPEADSYGPDTLRKIRQNLNADRLVVGSFIPLGKGQIRLDLRLQDAVQGATLAAFSEQGRESDMAALIGRAGTELRAKLGIGTPSEAAVAATRATLAANPDAVRLYSEGLAKLRSFDNAGARDLFEKAVALAPNFAVAHSALARAWKSLGYDVKAQEEAKKAFALSAGLGREERLSVEGQYREMANEWGKAVEIYGALFQFFPDNVEYGILLADAESRAGRGHDAIETIESLSKLPAPADSDARIDLAGAVAASSLGNFKLEQSFATSAAAKAEASGARLLEAQALYRQSSALEGLGQLKEATAAGEKAKAIYAAAGDRIGVASTLEVSGDVLQDQGDLAGAIASYSQELGIAREVGDKRAESSATNNLASVMDQQGDYAGARKMYEQALAAFREIDDKNNSPTALLDLGTVAQEEGDLSGAKNSYGQALAAFREINDLHGVSIVLGDLGTVFDAQGDFLSGQKLLEQALATDLKSGRKTPSEGNLVSLADVLQHEGDLAGAAKNYREGIEVSQAAGDKSMAAYAHFGLGNLAVARADFDGAKKEFEEALALREELGERGNVDATRVALAGLAIEQGHPDQAIASLRAARENLRKAKRGDEDVAATCLLARALLVEGKIGNAQQETDGMRAQARKSQNMGTRLDFAIADARVGAARGNSLAARKSLESALSEARRAGFREYEFEARLALAEIGLKSGHAGESRAELGRLESDAKGAGFDLIARKAAAAAR